LVAVALNAQTAAALVKDKPELSRVKEALADIMHANESAANIIKQFRRLLTRTRIEDIQETDLNNVIADAVSVLSGEASRRHVVLRAERPRGPLLVRADPVHLLQVFLNLTTNAMDALAEVSLDARSIEIRAALLGEGTAEIIVMDSGPGIPSRSIDDIFKTFYTSKKDGTGLGLSIARTIIESYGGRIWAENLDTGGAAFRFTLPVSRGVCAPVGGSSEPRLELVASDRRP
jgi:signal transduction histidine kinase